MYRSATSVRTIKPKVTIGVAPTFSSTSRLERRKEVLGANLLNYCIRQSTYYQCILVSVLQEARGETEST